MSKICWLLIGVTLLIVGCADDDDAATPSGGGAGESVPRQPVTAAELELLNDRATDVAESYWGAWPDDAIVDRFADDIAFYDPSDGDFLIEGKERFGRIMRYLIQAWSEADPRVEMIAVATDGAAYRVVAPTIIWPPWIPEPDQHPPVVFLDVFGFAADEITRYEIWMEDSTLEMLGFGCFAVDACPPAQALASRYVEAWSSGDPALIASLYAENATFTDSVGGIDAAGVSDISALSDRRFETEEPEIEIIDLYAQTNGYQTSGDDTEDVGAVIAIAIHYRASGIDEVPVEAVTTFELGTRRPDGFDLHPDGLITAEEVFHVVELEGSGDWVSPCGC